MIETMYLVQIIGLREDYFAILRFLQKLGMLHLKEEMVITSSESKFLDLPLKRHRDELHERETRLASLITHLDQGKKLEASSIEGRERYKTLSVETIIEQCDELINHLDPEFIEIERTQQILKSRQEQLTNFEPTLHKAQELVERIKQQENTEVLLIILDRRAETSLPEFERKVAEITDDQFQLQYRSLDENSMAVLVIFPTEYQSSMEAFLFGYRISQLWLPEDLRGLPFRELPERTQRIQERYQTQILAFESRKNELSEQFVQELTQLQQEVQFRIAGLNLLMNSFTTDTIFRIEGFVPEKHILEFETKLQEAFKSAITISKEKAAKNAPILLNNPSPINAFETLTNLGAVPKYKTIDPTPITFVLFPLFWGLMVGDIAYGLIILIGAYYLRKRVENQALKALGMIFMVAALWTIFFGFLFGEFFGDLAANQLDPIWFDRSAEQNILLFLQVSIVIGFIIVSFGLILGIYNNLQLDQRREALADGSIFLIWLFAGVALISIVALETSRLQGLSLFIVLMAIGALVWAEGPLGLLHILGRFSNILSYARLMAIGLISVMITDVANHIARTINPIVGIPFAIMLHIINILIAVLSPSVHALRLNIYEFFSQFQKAGGTPYRPFGYN